MIFKQLTDRGFQIKSKTHPVTVEKDGQTLQVGIRRARMDGSNIVVESGADSQDDIVALVFESVRLITPEQLQTMTVYSDPSAVEKSATDASLTGSVGSEIRSESISL
jgi:hypothetical protein